MQLAKVTCFHHDQLCNPEWLLFRRKKGRTKEGIYFLFKVVNFGTLYVL